MAVPTRSVATTAGTSKTIFCSSTAPTNDSSELACRRDSSLLRQTARRTALPMPTQKAKSHRRAGAGGDGTARVVESLSGGVETLLSTLHHAHIPFGPSVSALRSAVYFEDAHPHPATPADSLAYTTQWADRVTTSPHTNWAVCTTPSELRLCYLSHQSINAEMYVILQIPNPIQRKLCHVSVRVKTPAAADPSSEKETDSL
jgi:hypothetical protein